MNNPILLCRCGTEYRTANMMVGPQDQCPICRAEREARMRVKQVQDVELVELLERLGVRTVESFEATRAQLEKSGVAIGGYPRGLPGNVFTADVQRARDVVLKQHYAERQRNQLVTRRPRQ